MHVNDPAAIRRCRSAMGMYYPPLRGFRQGGPFGPVFFSLALRLSNELFDIYVFSSFFREVSQPINWTETLLKQSSLHPTG